MCFSRLHVDGGLFAEDLIGHRAPVHALPGAEAGCEPVQYQLAQQSAKSHMKSSAWR